MNGCLESRKKPPQGFFGTYVLESSVPNETEQKFEPKVPDGTSDLPLKLAALAKIDYTGF